MVLDGERDAGYMLLYHKELQRAEQTKYRHVWRYLGSSYASLRVRDASFPSKARQKYSH